MQSINYLTHSRTNLRVRNEKLKQSETDNQQDLLAGGSNANDAGSTQSGGKGQRSNSQEKDAASNQYQSWEQVYDNYRQLLEASNNGRSPADDTSGQNVEQSSDATDVPRNVVQQDSSPAKRAGSSGGAGRGQSNQRDSANVAGTPTRDLLDSGVRGSDELGGRDSKQRHNGGTNAQYNLVAGDNRDSGKPAKGDRGSNG